MKQILRHESLNDKGCYEIRLCWDGEWKPFIVDSCLPVVVEDLSKQGKSRTQSVVHSKAVLRGGVPMQASDGMMAYPAFCATPERQLWPALVEKAYAKAHGSYAQLSGGFISEGFSDLTGAPTETHVFGFFKTKENRDRLWAKLVTYQTEGFLMGVATAQGGDGLVGGHAYSVLDVIEVRDCLVGEQSKVTDFFSAKTTDDMEVWTKRNESERTTVRLLRIRNPWGKREWKGDWSADSERWTKTLRKRLGNTTYAKGDGTFFMSLEIRLIDSITWTLP